MRVLSLLRGVVLLRCHVSMIVFGIFSWNDIRVWWAICKGSTYLSCSTFEPVFPGKRVLAFYLPALGVVTWCGLGFISWGWSGIKWGPSSFMSRRRTGNCCDYCIVRMIYEKTTQLICFSFSNVLGFSLTYSFLFCFVVLQLDLISAKGVRRIPISSFRSISLVNTKLFAFKRASSFDIEG